MSYQFTAEELNELNARFNDAKAGIIEWYQVYQRVLEFISDIDPVTFELVPNETVQANVWPRNSGQMRIGSMAVSR